MALQPFATNYVTQASSVSPVAGLPGCFDVGFEPAGTSRAAKGLVRVDLAKGDCSWIGEWGPEHLRKEIERVEALCTPARGTLRNEVETRFGPGHATIASKIPPKEPVPPKVLGQLR